MEQVAHRNHVSKSQAVSLDHTKKKGRRSLENKVMIETMHTCMHRSSPYHSYYTSTNISLTKHMRSMRQIKFPVASISINYVVGLASQVLFFLTTQVLLIISMRYILLTIDNTGQLLPRKHLCQPLVITYSTWESIFDTGLTRLNLYAHTHIYRSR